MTSGIRKTREMQIKPTKHTKIVDQRVNKQRCKLSIYWNCKRWTYCLQIDAGPGYGSSRSRVRECNTMQHLATHSVAVWFRLGTATMTVTFENQHPNMFVGKRSNAIADELPKRVTLQHGRGARIYNGQHTDNSSIVQQTWRNMPRTIVSATDHQPNNNIMIKKDSSSWVSVTITCNTSPKDIHQHSATQAKIVTILHRERAIRRHQFNIGNRYEFSNAVSNWKGKQLVTFCMWCTATIHQKIQNGGHEPEVW